MSTPLLDCSDCLLETRTSVDTTPGLCRHHSWTVLTVCWKPELVSTPFLDCVDTTASFVLTVCWKTALVSTPPLDCVDTPLDCVNTTVNCVDTTVTCVDIAVTCLSSSVNLSSVQHVPITDL
ncbi:hypothetical protein Taro_037996 [Colocasia esculenta]|uniref:Uncharacterized protein n=1 Tax=Colocasia esculenta TaxID=4460 RepID=A0A843WRD1_COLES|nr:hypothetical protein [Colocasia esculenta]